MGLLAAPALAQVRAQFDVPKQSLANSLLTIGRQAGVNVLFDPPLVEGRGAPGVKAELTIDEALTLLLEGSGLKHRFLDDKTVLVIRAGSERSQTDVSSSTRVESAHLEEIVVTATRREESLRDVPQSLNVLTGDALAQSGARSIQDYAALVPGLQLINLQPGGWNMQVMRGISTGTNASSATVGTYFDDTPTTGASLSSLGQAVTPDPDLFDVRRVEVLKGPQGTLYGASAMGGLIKYVSNPPDLRKFEGKAESSYESVSDGSTGNSQRALVNVPLAADTLAIRLSGFRVAYPGYIDNVFRNQGDINEGRSQGGRISSLWKPNEELSVRLTSYYQRITADNPGPQDVNPHTLEPTSGELKTARKLPEPTYTKWFVNNLTLTYDLPWANLLSSTSYAKQYTRNSQDQSNSYAPLLNLFGIGGNANLFTGVTSTEKKTQEMRLTSPGDEKVEWIGGLYYTDEEAVTSQSTDQYDATGATATLVFPDAITGNIKSRIREAAGFATLTYRFGPSFDVQAGARYSRVKQDYEQWGITLAGIPTSPDFVGDAEESKTTYLGVARYHFNEDTMLYGRLATGYRPGGPNIILLNSEAPASYQSDTLISYELGLKGILAARTFDYGASVFRIDWEDIQIIGFDPAANINFFTNGGKAHSQGLELEFGYRPVAGLRLGVSAAFIDAKLDESIPAGGVTAQAGSELPYAPEVSYSATVDYERALSDAVNGFAGLTVVGVGKRRAFFADQTVGGLPPIDAVTTADLPSYTTLDLRAGLRWGRVTLTAFARNVTDERAAFALLAQQSGVDPVNNTVGPGSITVVQPRTFGLTARFEF